MTPPWLATDDVDDPIDALADTENFRRSAKPSPRFAVRAGGMSDSQQGDLWLVALTGHWSPCCIHTSLVPRSCSF